MINTLISFDFFSQVQLIKVFMFLNLETFMMKQFFYGRIPLNSKNTTNKTNTKYLTVT